MKRSQLERKFLEEDHEARLEFVRAALTTREGRLFFWWLLQVGKHGVNPFASNALQMSFGCGEMNVGAQILDVMLEAAPMKFPEMMIEQSQLQELRDAKLSASSETEETSDD